jgi:hypothetical protein
MMRQSHSDQAHKYDHLIPPAKKVLKFTARATWFMMKTLVKAAFYLPTAISKAAAHNPPAPKPRRDMPSPDSAFPAPE